MQRPRRRRPRARRRRARTVTGESPPRSTWATAAPDAPVPERERLADAALEDPGADRVRRELAPERHVRAVREQRRVLDLRADRRRRSSASSSSRLGDADRALRVADRDVLEAPVAAGDLAGPSAGPPGSPSTSAARGPCRRGRCARPVIVGRISPATVWIENCRRSVQPRRRRYRIASRAPLPDSSASEPSGLKIRRRATKPGLVGRRRARARRRRRGRSAGRTAADALGVSANGQRRRSTIR